MNTLKDVIEAVISDKKISATVLFISDSDFTSEQIKNIPSGLNKQSYSDFLGSDLVIYNGKIVKNRFGECSPQGV